MGAERAAGTATAEPAAHATMPDTGASSRTSGVIAELRRWVRRELDRLGLPWAYWDFATDFGAYDRDRRAWRRELLAALMG